MGWWDYSIMGGDQPCDWEIILLDQVCGISDEEPHDQFVHIISNKLPDMIERVKDDYIGKQVLGVIILASGLPRNDIVNEALRIAREGAVSDEWQHHDENRKQAIDSFITTIDNYSGEPILLESKTLMESIFETVAEIMESEAGEKLINVGPISPLEQSFMAALTDTENKTIH
jgi:hypothetical protein